MDLSKLNLPPNEQTALSHACALVAQSNRGFTITKIVDCITDEPVDVSFNVLLNTHQELIESLESTGYFVIDGSKEVLTSLLSMGMLIGKQRTHSDDINNLIVLYSAAWVADNSNDLQTVMVAYHILVATKPNNGSDLSTIQTVAVGKFPLTKGVVVQDCLIAEYLEEISESGNDEDED